MIEQFILLLKKHGEVWVKYPSFHRRNGETAHYLLKDNKDVIIRYDFHHVEYPVCELCNTHGLAREFGNTYDIKILIDNPYNI